MKLVDFRPASTKIFGRHDGVADFIHSGVALLLI